MGDKKCGGLRLPLLVVELVARLERCPSRATVFVSSVAIVESRDDDGMFPPLAFPDPPSAGGRSCESGVSFASPTASSSARGGKTENDDVPSPLVALLLKSRLLPATSSRLQAKEVAEFATKLPGNLRLRSMLVMMDGVGGRVLQVAVEL